MQQWACAGSGLARTTLLEAVVERGVGWGGTNGRRRSVLSTSRVAVLTPTPCGPQTANRATAPLSLTGAAIAAIALAALAPRGTPRCDWGRSRKYVRGEYGSGAARPTTSSSGEAWRFPSRGKGVMWRPSTIWKPAGGKLAGLLANELALARRRQPPSPVIRYRSPYGARRLPPPRQARKNHNTGTL